MDIITISRKEKDFTLVYNEPLRNGALSLRARGLLCTLLSFSRDWDFTVAGLIAVLPDGRDIVYSAIDELMAAGFCKREEVRTKGRFGGYKYTFSEYSIDEWKSPHTGKPYTEVPHAVSPYTENPTQIKNQSNKESINNTPYSPPTKFVAPTLDEVRQYADQRGNLISAEEFYDKNVAVGWIDKHGHKYKDWKAAYRTWERYRKNTEPTAGPAYKSARGREDF